jgi:4-hydroxy-tetrahydrodipicolinate synthase
MTLLHGIYVPLVTPFTADGEVATDALATLAHEVLDAGAAGIVALGTTAEHATLTEAERHAVLDVCAGVAAERGAALTIGAGSNDTRATAQALAGLKRWPAATAALVPVPYFSRPGEAGVIAHVTHVAAASPVPLVVYHIPHRTGQDLGAAALREIGGLPGVAGFKYATHGLDQDTVDLLGDPPPDCSVLAGEDAVLGPMLALGAAGGIVATAHLATARFVELADAWRRGDAAHARSLGHRLARLSAALFASPNPTVLKGVLHAQGRIPSPVVRLPLLPASTGAVERTLTLLEE